MTTVGNFNQSFERTTPVVSDDASHRAEPGAEGTTPAVSDDASTISGSTNDVDASHRATLETVRASADRLLEVRKSDGPGRKAAEMLAQNKLQADLRGLSAMQCSVAPELVADLLDARDKAMMGAGMAVPARNVAGIAGDSSFEIWNNLSAAIGSIKDDYLTLYEKSVAKNTEFYREFSKILADMGKYIDKGKDENYVKLDTGSLSSRLKNLMHTYRDVKLFSGKEADAKAWAERLGLPAECVKYENGTYVVKLDMAPVQKMYDATPAVGTDDGWAEMSSAKFQSWKAGFASQEENLKNTMQAMGQKYSNANSLYDNLVQVLSKTISSMLDTDKSFFQN